jgi:hypothetical protein
MILAVLAHRGPADGQQSGCNKETGANQGAYGSPSLSVHRDAIDMELTSRFVKAGKETL